MKELNTYEMRLKDGRSYKVAVFHAGDLKPVFEAAKKVVDDGRMGIGSEAIVATKELFGLEERSVEELWAIRNGLVKTIGAMRDYEEEVYGLKRGGNFDVLTEMMWASTAAVEDCLVKLGQPV